MAPTLEFFNIRSLQIYLGQKLVYLGIFGLKSYMRSAPSNLPNCKVWCKITILKFGTILICVFLGVEFENTIVILETNTSNLSNCKISRTRMPKFGTKNAWFEYFRAGIWKGFVIFEICVLDFVLLQSWFKSKNP